MRGVDTNVLVRIVARDDVDQLHAAEDFVAAGAWVSHLVLAEAVWVLTSIYGLAPREIAATIERLLGHETLTFENPDVVAAALAQYRARPTLKFSDCLIVAIAIGAGKTPLATFDRDLAKVPGTRRLST
jgi:predicted nucleic-acid-binding protein